jgi:hypothetical protein
MKGKSQIFTWEFANFAWEILEELRHRRVIQSNGVNFCFRDVDFEAQAISKEC